MPGDSTKRYPPELRERAVRMVAEIRGEHESEWAAMARVAELLGVGTPETVRKWVRQAQVDAGSRAGTSTEDSVEVKRLRRENAELKRANAILKAASASSRPSSTGRSADCSVCFRAQGLSRWWSAVGCRADLCGPEPRAGLPDRPINLLRHVAPRPTQRELADEALKADDPADT